MLPDKGNCGIISQLVIVAQEKIVELCRKEANVVGAIGVQAETGTRFFHVQAEDSGASINQYWKRRQYLRMLPGLHVIINIGKMVLSAIKCSDNQEHSHIAALMTYTTVAQQILFFKGSSKRKGIDATLRVFLPAALKHLICSVLDRNGWTPKDNDEMALAIYDDLHEPEGHGTYRNLVSLVFQILLPFDLIVQALHTNYDPQLDHFRTFLAGLKAILPYVMASGMIYYGPDVAFFLVMVEDLYKDNAEMWDFFRKYYLLQTEEGLKNGVPPKGVDEPAEEEGQRWHHALQGRDYEAYQQAMTLMPWIASFREHLMFMVSKTMPVVSESLSTWTNMRPWC